MNNENNTTMNELKRLQIMKFGEPCVRYFQNFFARPEVFGVPQDLDSIFCEFVNDYTGDTNKASYALCTFKKKIAEWCELNNIVMNPNHLMENNIDRHSGYFNLKAWVTDASGRELKRTNHACLFYREGDKIPSSYTEFLQGVYKDFINNI